MLTVNDHYKDQLKRCIEKNPAYVQNMDGRPHHLATAWLWWHTYGGGRQNKKWFRRHTSMPVPTC